MNLQEIFEQLTYGELSQLSIGGGEAGVIDESNYPRVIAHVNLGLTDLYTRFNLKVGRVLLELVEGRTDYPLLSKYARANTRSREATRYLVDSTDSPFLEDVNKVERVLTEDGFALALNDESNKYSARTPTSNTLYIPQDIVDVSSSLPDELRTNYLELVYRAGHPKIVAGIGYFDPSRISVHLPDSHLNALLLFVASRVHNPVGMVNEFNAGNNYAMKYEAECARLDNKNLQVDQDSRDATRFQARGWV